MEDIKFRTIGLPARMWQKIDKIGKREGIHSHQFRNQFLRTAADKELKSNHKRKSSR
ncbi:MAG: hypothetical protein KW804_02150 [Candidatus Doudnabacteria bacterium]|nr:hypothetical protein [Candidatus Doudnabacteria bacterium]